MLSADQALEELVAEADSIYLENVQALGLLTRMVDYATTNFLREKTDYRFQRLLRFGFMPSEDGLMALLNVKFLAKSLKKSETWVRDFLLACEFHLITRQLVSFFKPPKAPELDKKFEEIYGNYVNFLSIGWEYWGWRQ